MTADAVRSLSSNISMEILKCLLIYLQNPSAAARDEGGARTAFACAVHEYERDKVVRTELPSSRLVLSSLTTRFDPLD